MSANRKRPLVETARLRRVPRLQREQPGTVQGRRALPACDDGPAALDVARRDHPQTPRVAGKLVRGLRLQHSHGLGDLLALRRVAFQPRISERGRECEAQAAGALEHDECLVRRHTVSLPTRASDLEPGSKVNFKPSAGIVCI